MLTSNKILKKFKAVCESTSISKLTTDDGTGRNRRTRFHTYSKEDSIDMLKVFKENNVELYHLQPFILSILGVHVGIEYTQKDKTVSLFHSTSDTTKDRAKLEKMPADILKAVNNNETNSSPLTECAKYGNELSRKILNVQILYRPSERHIMSSSSRPVKLPRGWYKKMKVAVENDPNLTVIYTDDTYQNICVKYKDTNVQLTYSKEKLEGLRMFIVEK